MTKQNETKLQWHCPTISSSVVPFSSCFHTFPTSASFPGNLLFSWDGQSNGALKIRHYCVLNVLWMWLFHLLAQSLWLTIIYGSPCLELYYLKYKIQHTRDEGRGGRRKIMWLRTTILEFWKSAAIIPSTLARPVKLIYHFILLKTLSGRFPV